MFALTKESRGSVSIGTWRDASLRAVSRGEFPTHAILTFVCDDGNMEPLRGSLVQLDAESESVRGGS